MARTVVVADDHPLFRAALRAAVERAVKDADVKETATLAEALAQLRTTGASLLCLDLNMGDSKGFSGLMAVRQEFASVPVIVVSASEEPSVVRRAIHFGAAGFIPKSASLDEIVQAIMAVESGEIAVPRNVDLDGNPEEAKVVDKLSSLTDAQRRVLIGLSEGLLNKQIAHQMGITEATVKAHMTAVFRKLNVLNRTQALIMAQALAVTPQRIDDAG